MNKMEQSIMDNNGNKKQKPSPMLRARTLPAIITPALNILNAQLQQQQQQYQQSDCGHNHHHHPHPSSMNEQINCHHHLGKLFYTLMNGNF